MSADRSWRESSAPGSEGIAGAVLILGGTSEGRALAAAAAGVGVPVVSSLAGRVSRPALPVGQVRIGGFGGAVGLQQFLTTHRIRAVVDATHPFAATMTSSAAVACAATGVPLLRLARPGWSGRPAAADWRWVDSIAAAAATTDRLGRRPFLTTGRQTLEQFRILADRFVLVRVVEPPDTALPVQWELVRDRGPYSLTAELSLMRSAAVDVLVTKDSGGDYTSAKLDAASKLGIPVVIVRRPAAPGGVQLVESVPPALAWLSALGTPGSELRQI